jgi:hypothetical protein
MPHPPRRNLLPDEHVDFGEAVASQLACVARQLVLEHTKTLQARDTDLERTIVALRKENLWLRQQLQDPDLQDSCNIPSAKAGRLETSNFQTPPLTGQMPCVEASAPIIAVGSPVRIASQELPLVAIGSPVRTMHDAVATSTQPIVMVEGSPVRSPVRRLSAASPAPSSEKSSPWKRLRFSSGNSAVEIFHLWSDLMISPDECHPPTVDFCPTDDFVHTTSMILALNRQGTAENLEQSKCALCRHLVMNPSSRARLIWEVLGIPLLTYDLALIPMQVFEIPPNSVTKGISSASMMYWTLDLLASFFVGYHTSDSKLVMDWAKICKRYLRFTFWLDLFIVAIDWLLLAVASMEASGLEAMGIARIGKLLRVLRVFRVLRLLRLRKLRHLLQCLQDRIDSEYLSIVLNICKNMTCIIVASHFVACLWFLVGKQEYSGYSSWVEVYNLKDGIAWEYKYLTSLHWAICQFTPGSMNVQPQNVVERIFSILMLLCSLLVFSMFVSSLTNSMRTLQNLSSKDAHQLWLLRKFFRQNEVSRDLARRIMRYVNLVLLPQQERVQQKDVEMLTQLSSHLRVELSTELHMPSLTIHPFFDWFSKKSLPVMRQLCCLASKRTSLSRGDVLFGAGQRASEMFFPVAGQLAYTPQREGCQETLLSKGQWCCEAVLWCPWVYHGTLRAKIECELISLEAEKFRKVVTEHFIHLCFAQTYGLAFVQCLNDAAKSADTNGSNYISDLSHDLHKSEALAEVLSS